MTHKRSAKADSEITTILKLRYRITPHYSLTMSHLIPTPRTDKNGRTVIRHVKPPTTSTDKNQTALPTPTMLAPKKNHATIAADAMDTLVGVLYTKYRDGLPTKTLTNISEALTRYSDATLDRVQQHEWTVKSADHFSVGITRTWDETKANDYMAATKALREYEPDSIPPRHYDSWQHYPELHPANNDGDYPEERLSQITALYLVTEHMIANDREPYYWDDLTNDIAFIYLDDDDQLRDFLLNPGNDYARDNITSIITTHHTYDPEKIKRMLDLGVPSMTSGVL